MKRLFACGVLCTLLLLVMAPAGAQDFSDTGWVIEQMQVTLLVSDDGYVTVEEKIAVDFAGLQKHGIFRVIPVRYDVPGDPDLLRVLELDAISVESTAPADIEVSRPAVIGDDRDVVIRIGDPDITITGKQTYTLRYRVRGALNSFPDHDELFWNATGNGWPVPIRWAHARVRGGLLLKVTCFRGPLGATSLCDDSGVLPGEYPVWATATQLQPGEGLTVVAGFQKGSITVPPAIYEDRWTLRRAFTGSGAAWPLFFIVAIAVTWLLSRWLWRAGRDRAALSGVSAAGFVEGPERLRPRGGITIVPEFRPPSELRPAQLGLLIDERVDDIEVSATIVDLAVRGYLVIEERESKGVLWFSKTDWALKRTERDAADVLPYEKRLLDGLFLSGDETTIAELKGSFASEYRLVSGDIEDDAVKRGWFKRRPTSTRTMWLGAGLGMSVAGLAAVVIAALFTTFAIAAVPLFLAGLVTTVAHRWMPARTAEGSRLFARTLGFREYIRKAEVDRMEFAEAQRLFVDYLPYAVAFGAVEHWAKTFEALGVTAASVGGWYVGGMYPHAGGLHHMSAGLSDFARSVGGSLPVTPASSGSSGFSGGGFSGGGFGGGGGGSW